MMKRLVRISLALVAVFLVACGQEEEPTPTNTPPRPTATHTATPSPTATPLPTKTPTPTPIPLDPVDILDKALTSLDTVESYRSISNQEFTLSFEGLTLEAESNSDTVVLSPDRWSSLVETSILGETIVERLIWIDETLYIKEASTDWVLNDNLILESVDHAETLASIVRIDELEDLKFVGEERIDGRMAYLIKAGLTDIHELVYSVYPKELLDMLAAQDMSLDFVADFQIDYWIDVSNDRLIRADTVGTMVVYVFDSQGSGETFEMKMTLDATSDFLDYNEPVSIEAPEIPEYDIEVITAVPARNWNSPKVCVVLDIGGVYDKSFNEYTLTGAVAATEEHGMELQYAVAKYELDYEKLINRFISVDCDLIVTVGFLMGDATAAAARVVPDISFVIVDNQFLPGWGCSQYFGDCYEEDLTNVTSLMFAEDEAGYLAGVMAGCMSETNVIGSVSGMEIPPVVKFVTGYQNGARSQNPDIVTLNVYIPDFNDPATGKRAAEVMIDDGADVIFGVGGNTGNGGLLAAHQAGIFAIGIDVDEYYTYPFVASSLLTSAVKEIELIVYDAVNRFANGELQAGIMLGDAGNDGIGLAPFHDQESNIPDACATAIETAKEGLAAGTVSTGYLP